MAYGLKYYAEFSTVNCVDVRVEFQYTGYTGSSEKVYVAEPYVQIEAPEIDRYEPIFSKGAMINLKQSKDEPFKFKEIFIGGERDWKVTIKHDNQVVFKGFVVAEVFSQPLIGKRNIVVQIPVTDGLKLTQATTYRVGEQLDRFENWFDLTRDILNDIGLDLPIKIHNELKSDKQGFTDTQNLMRRHYLDPYLYDEKDGEEILRSILAGMRISQINGQWVIERIETIGESTKDYEVYSTGGTWSELSGQTTCCHTVDSNNYKYIDGASEMEFCVGYKTINLNLKQEKLDNLITPDLSQNRCYSSGSLPSFIGARDIALPCQITTYSWDPNCFDGIQSIFCNVGSSSACYIAAACCHDWQTDGIITRFDFTPETPALYNASDTGGTLCICWNYYADCFELKQIESLVGAFFLRTPTSIFLQDCCGTRYIRLCEESDAPDSRCLVYECQPGTRTPQSWRWCYPNFTNELELDTCLNAWKIPVNIELQYCDIIPNYPGSIFSDHTTSVQLMIGNLNFGFVSYCPLNRTYVRELTACASQLIDVENVVTGTINSGFTKTYCNDLDLFDTINRNYANNIMYYCATYNTYLPTCYWGENIFDTATYQEHYIKDAYSIYSKGRTYITTDMRSCCRINENEIIIDDNINTNSSCFFLTGMNWNLKNEVYRLRLNEYEQREVNLI